MCQFVELNLSVAVLRIVLTIVLPIVLHSILLQGLGIITGY